MFYIDTNKSRYYRDQHSKDKMLAKRYRCDELHAFIKEYHDQGNEQFLITPKYRPHYVSKSKSNGKFKEGVIRYSIECKISINGDVLHESIDHVPYLRCDLDKDIEVLALVSPKEVYVKQLLTHTDQRLLSQYFHDSDLVSKIISQPDEVVSFHEEIQKRRGFKTGFLGIEVIPLSCYKDSVIHSYVYA